MVLYHSFSMARKVRPSSWIDPSVLYTRSEIAERVGLSDDVLSFWIKRKLLVPEGEAAGKGVHLRFHYSQVGVAVILKALRDHFGANIGTLKSLAATLQEAIRLFRATKAPVGVWSAATSLANSLGKFRRGEPVPAMLYNHETEEVDRKTAATEAEIIAGTLQVYDGDPSTIIQLAEAIGPDRSTETEIAMVTLGVPLEPRRAGAPFYWLLYQVDGRWVIRVDSDEGSTSRRDVRPAMFLPVYSMVGKVWSIPTNLRALDMCARLRAALKDAGVEADVSPGEPHPEVRVGRDEDKPKAQDILNNFFKPDWMKKRDGDDFSAYPSPSDYDDIYWTPEDHAAEIRRVKDELVELDKQEQAELDKRR